MTDRATPPVLFLIFNRPNTTEIVFEEIRKARPKQLFIAADGPRKNKAGELEKCQQVRAISGKVDWECEVKTLYREENFGCGKAISGAITWFFDHVEEGIILEDDTKPSQSFFRYCGEMLERYRDDSRVMEIAGSALPNYLTAKGEYSYFFSDWDYIWGWATWKRAWKHFDYSMKFYPEVVQTGYLRSNYTSVHERFYMDHMLDRSYYENSDVTWWSVQWGFARKINSGLVVVPIKNMVVNLGFGEGATNTANSTNLDFMKLEEVEFPLKHPDYVMRNRTADKEVFTTFLTTPASRIKGKLKSILPKSVYDLAKNSIPRIFFFNSLLVLACQ